MLSFKVSVDYSNVYGNRTKFSRNLIEVNVSSDTTIGKVKSTVLNYLRIPYEDLYYIEFRGQRLEDNMTIGALNVSKNVVLALKCSNFDELYSRMRRDGRL
jgi:hypothetical protein